MEQRQREFIENPNRKIDGINELKRGVDRQFAAAIAYAKGDITAKQLLDTARLNSEASDNLLDEKMVSVDRLSLSDLKELFPQFPFTNAKTPWTKNFATVPISKYTRAYLCRTIRQSGFVPFFEYVLRTRGLKVRLDFRIVRNREFRYTSTAAQGYGRTIYGSPACTVVSGAADKQVQQIVVIEDREMKLEMKVKEARILAFMFMARENQNLEECYHVYGLVINNDSFRFYRLDTLKGEWSRKCFSFSDEDYCLQNIVDFLVSILEDTSRRKSAYENVARRKLAHGSRLAKFPSADDKQCAGDRDGDEHIVWTDDEAPTGHKDTVKEAPSSKSKEPSVGATVPVGRRHKRLKSFHISNVQDKTAEDNVDNSSTIKDNSSSNDTQESEENQSVSDHDSPAMSDYGDWEILQRSASAGQV